MTARETAARTVGTLDLPAPCAEMARRVDEDLVGFLADQRAVMSAADPGVSSLFEELERVIGSGGKRLRPVFCCLGQLAAGSDVGAEGVRAAAALELLHTFAIVHDDVMDRSVSRRGSPASWVHLGEEHRRQRYVGDPEGYGLAAAVLAGDMALVLADRALMGASFPEDRMARALARYDRMRVEVVAGQFLDVQAAHRGSADEGQTRRIAVMKSGGYTVEAPLQIGAILGGADEDQLEVLSRYGIALGEAFQLRDDVLGVFGDPDVTGKDRDSDLIEGKRTVLLAKAIDAASGDDRRFLEERIGRGDLTPEEVERARNLMASTGALDDTLRLIDDLVQGATASLADEGLLGQAGDLLGEMARIVAVRRL
ncbi:MAG TPA: polyprenyl synthetase family protein [Actinomycetota bacterium]|nr:polyprenyl synthetase family protein [Actinomycetota bacterium]